MSVLPSFQNLISTLFNPLCLLQCLLQCRLLPKVPNFLGFLPFLALPLDLVTLPLDLATLLLVLAALLPDLLERGLTALFLFKARPLFPTLLSWSAIFCNHNPARPSNISPIPQLSMSTGIFLTPILPLSSPFELPCKNFSLTIQLPFTQNSIFRLSKLTDFDSPSTNLLLDDLDLALKPRPNSPVLLSPLSRITSLQASPSQPSFL